jgi:SAM-dependent methyltransferase
VNTKQGAVTRPGLDSAIELDFLREFIDPANMRVLDIGAGYGRLAVDMARTYPRARVSCVDATPVSTYIQRRYTAVHCSRVQVLTLNEYDAIEKVFDLAINVHCWSECAIDDIKRWLDSFSSKYLFTVVHTHHYASSDKYFFKYALEAKYKLVAERTGLSVSPDAVYAFWEAK